MKRILRSGIAAMLAALILAVTVIGLQAAGFLFWPSGGVPISQAVDDQVLPQSISDGTGGAIIAWQDFRSGTDYDIYTQRVSPNGQRHWTMDGVTVTHIANDQTSPVLASDEHNGALIAWQDMRNGTDDNVFAQRVLSNGIPLWNTNGITICAAAGTQDAVQIAGDGQGGAIIVWEDNRSGTHYDVYAQRVNASGNAMWAADGVKVTDVPVGNKKPVPVITSDGANGALIAWMNQSTAPSSNIMVQHLLPTGAAAWATGGISLTANGHSLFPTIIHDGGGGAIVAWELGGLGIMSQRVRANGTPAWGTNGITLSAQSPFSPTRTGFAQLVTDGSQGAFVSWYRSESALSSKVVAQHVLSNSVQVWATEGISLSSAPGYQNPVALMGDGYGGIIAIWLTGLSNLNSVWAQRVSADGVPQWTPEGVVVKADSAADLSSDTAAATSDMAHGAIVVWEDLRNRMNTDIDLYAQRVVDFTPTHWIYLPLTMK